MAADNDLVFINLDETSVERLVPHRFGNVVRVPREGPGAAAVYERISRRDTHGHLTLVGLVTATAEIQQYLLQFLLLKDANSSVAERAAFAAVPAPLEWFRGSAGWVTAANFPAILTRIRRAVHVRRPRCTIVLVLDCAPQHLADNVINHARRLRIVLLYVPARLTWLLQPLDTHVFAHLKRRLHALQLDARCASADGVLHGTAWLHLLCQAAQEVVSRANWSPAFVANGVSHGPATMRGRVLEFLSATLPLPLRAPTHAEVLEVIGGRRPLLPAKLLALPTQLAALGGAARMPIGRRLPPPPLPPPAEAPPGSSSSSAPMPISAAHVRDPALLCLVCDALPLRKGCASVSAARCFHASMVSVAACRRFPLHVVAGTARLFFFVVSPSIVVLAHVVIVVWEADIPVRHFMFCDAQFLFCTTVHCVRNCLLDIVREGQR